MVRGTVHQSEGGVYRVTLDSGEAVDASLRGRLKRGARLGDSVVIGDVVGVALGPDGSASIEVVEERRSQVVRRGAGGRHPKVVAANVDRLLVVAAAVRPEPRQALLDRLLVVGEANHITPVLVMNKVDLAREICGKARCSGSPARSAPDLLALYRGIGYQVVETSARTGEGLDALRDLLAGGLSAMVGPSGVGKTSLLNALEPHLGLRVGDLSHRRGQGRHTTVSARLLTLSCGGLVADTPGFSDVGVWGVRAENLGACFPEFLNHQAECRFRGCTHLHEPGCEVRAAVARGAIDPGRFESYRVLVDEAGVT
jgi:ribosome biogenesis GTPase